MSQLNVLVTGGGRGIGRSIALAFARAFASEEPRVVVAARTRSELDAVAGEIDGLGGRALAVPMDVADLSSVEHAIAASLEHTDGVLDVLVNNAGIFKPRPFRELSPATWYETIAVNLNGPFHVTLLALKGLELSERAHVFNICSTAGQQGFPDSTAYCASKFGLRGFGDALRTELDEVGIRVSTVYPGGTDTSIFDNVPGDWDRAAMNRPEDVAQVVLDAFWAPAGADVADLNVP